MPSKSKSEARFAAMSSSPEGRKALAGYGKKPMPVKVAKEFVSADNKAGREKLPERVHPQTKKAVHRKIARQMAP